VHLHAKKKAPSQRGEGARGLSGWLSDGPKAKSRPGLGAASLGDVERARPLPQYLLWRYLSRGVGVSVLEKALERALE